MTNGSTVSGKFIGGYELHEIIGTGGFGRVVRAFQPSVGREVAIKIIHPKYVNHPTFIRRFEAEAHLIARLEHPHIVPLIDYWHENDDAFIVMRWLRGGSVRKLLKSGSLEMSVIAKLLDQICDALSFAHRAGIIHRDLKPDNILLDEEGNFYLSDFGIAKDLTVDVGLTPEGIIIGSTPYLAPEQIRQQSVTPRSDIYALGIILYELLVGEHPFANLSHEQMIYKHVNEPFPLLPANRTPLNTGLDTVIQRATAKEPMERFADALELAAAFRDVATEKAGPFVSNPQRSSAAAANTVILPALTALKGSLKARLYHDAGAVLEQPRRLIGRKLLIDKIHKLLAENERVLLHGLGGIGKTSLAATVTADYLAAGHTDAIWLEAGNADENALFETLARTFDQQQEIARAATGERVGAMRQILLDKKSLLVLDNVWNDRALFQMLKAIPAHMPVLITSRHVMPIDGVVLHVEELDPNEALELFSYHARKDYQDDPNAKALCRQLGYHPFALEIAGKRIKVQRHMTPALMMESIAGAPHQLSLPADFAETGREGIINLIDDSVNELDANERRIFREMGGMFVPTGTAELLALSLSQSMERVESALDDLQQRGLVQIVPQVDSAPVHYRLHDLTYSYARFLFMQAGEGRESLVTAVQTFVNQHAEDYDLLEFEQHNILGAARSAHHLDNNSALIDIIKVLAVDGEYFAARGHTKTSLDLLKDAIDEAKVQQRPEVAHRLLGKLGDAYREFYRDFDHAIENYQEALDLAPNPERRAILLAVIGTTRFLQGADDAETYYVQADQIARDNHSDMTLLAVLNHRGYYAMKKQDYETGRRLLGEAVTIATAAKLAQHQFFSLLNRGECENLLGHFEQALATHEEAAQLARTQKNHLWEAHALRDIGEDYHAMGNREQAQEKLEEALTLWRQSSTIAEAADLVRYMETQGYTVPPLQG